MNEELESFPFNLIPAFNCMGNESHLVNCVQTSGYCSTNNIISVGVNCTLNGKTCLHDSSNVSTIHVYILQLQIASIQEYHWLWLIYTHSISPGVSPTRTTAQTLTITLSTALLQTALIMWGIIPQMLQLVYSIHLSPWMTVAISAVWEAIMRLVMESLSVPLVSNVWSIILLKVKFNLCLPLNHFIPKRNQF